MNSLPALCTPVFLVLSLGACHQSTEIRADGGRTTGRLDGSVEPDASPTVDGGEDAAILEDAGSELDGGHPVLNRFGALCTIHS